MYEIPSFHLLRHSQIPRFIDCDMFMHFVGGAIGHKESGHMQQSMHLNADEDLEEADADEDPEEADIDKDPEEADTDKDLEEVDADEDPEEADADEDSEEADTEEEADYRYVDDFEIEGEDNNWDLVSKDLENDDNDEYDVL